MDCCGNWKMHNTIAESIALAKANQGRKRLPFKNGEVVIAPPLPPCSALGETIKGSNVSLATPQKHVLLRQREHSRERNHRAAQGYRIAPT